MAQPTPDNVRAPTAAYWLTLAALALAVGWAYAPSFAEYADRWSNDPQHSHGFVVPIFSLFLLWHRREMLREQPLSASWLGLGVVLCAVLVRLVGARYYLPFLDGFSLMLLLAGAAMTLGGMRALQWSWPAIGFLVFMLPLPFRVESALQGPLRSLGTRAGTIVLQTMGLPAYASGNVIHVDEYRIGVVEACSGLRMLMVFFALATATIVFHGRFLWEKLVIVASAIPIALIANVARIAITGYFYGTGQEELADRVFHDLAGWLMMPMALGLLALELWLLSKIFVVETGEPVVFRSPTTPLPLAESR